MLELDDTHLFPFFSFSFFFFHFLRLESLERTYASLVYATAYILFHLPGPPYTPTFQPNISRSFYFYFVSVYFIFGSQAKPTSVANRIEQLPPTALHTGDINLIRFKDHILSLRPFCKLEETMLSRIVVHSSKARLLKARSLGMIIDINRLMRNAL